MRRISPATGAGKVAPPGDKLISHRAAILALSRSGIEVENFSPAPIAPAHCAASNCSVAMWTEMVIARV